MSVNGANLVFDPARMVLDIFGDLYPGHRCDVFFGPEADDDGYGFTDFPDDGGKPKVVIAFDCPIGALPEILSHELAHVVAGADADHGPAWEAVMAALHAEYHRRFAEIDTGPLVALTLPTPSPEEQE